MRSSPDRASSGSKRGSPDLYSPLEFRTLRGMFFAQKVAAAGFTAICSPGCGPWRANYCVKKGNQLLFEATTRNTMATSAPKGVVGSLFAMVEQ
jgi:hypothetical protein